MVTSFPGWIYHRICEDVEGKQYIFVRITRIPYTQLGTSKKYPLMV